MPDKRPIMLVDGLNVHMRHFIANPSMGESGQHVGGVVGFLKGLQLLVDRVRPSRIIIVWEGGGSPRRRAIYSGYKSGRRPQKLNRFYDEIPDSVENRNYQLSLTIELLRYTPVNQIYVSDCEADDIIGYLVKNTYRDNNVVIVSSDKDYYQLISERTTQWSPGQKKFIGPSDVFKKFGIPVNNFCVTRCFIGDPSDGLEGIKGAGFKTMAKRFPELTSESDCLGVEDIIGLSQQKMPNSKIKLFKEINENREIVRRNWRLMYLGISNLSASHIEKINYKIDTFSPAKNKIELIRTMLREGIRNFDVDTFFMSLCSTTR